MSETESEPEFAGLDAAEAVEPPPFKGIAKYKLNALLKEGWKVTGYAIEKDGRHGFVTTGSFVGWWLPEYYPNHTSGDEPPNPPTTEGSET